MAQIFRVTAAWTGFAGGPGYTNLYFRNAVPGGAPTTIDDRGSSEDAYNRVHAFYTAIKAMFPDDVTINILPTVDQLQDTDGALERSYTVPVKAAIRGIEPGTYSAASGAVVGWGTDTVRNRRRIRGRTFIVPVAGNSYGTGGRLAADKVTLLQTAATAMAIGGLNSTFGVWARPVEPTEKNPDVEARPGLWAEATSVKVTDLPAVLRSRRD